MKITVPTGVKANLELTIPHVSHVSYADISSTKVEVTFSTGLFGDELAYVSMSPDEAEVLAKELIIRAYRARVNK